MESCTAAAKRRARWYTSPLKHDWFNNEETFRDVYAKKSPEYLEIVAKNMTPVWDSEQSKYVAEEEREESETASLEEEITFLREESNTTSTTTTSSNEDEDEVTVTNLESGDSDDLPF